LKSIISFSSDDIDDKKAIEFFETIADNLLNKFILMVNEKTSPIDRD